MAKKKEKNLAKDLQASAHQIWLAGLGALAVAEEEGGKVFKSLVEKGEGMEERGKKGLQDVSKRMKSAKGKAEKELEKLGDSFDDRVAGALNRLGVPTRSEVKKLIDRVEALTKKVDQLKPKKTTTRKKATTRRKTKAA